MLKNNKYYISQAPDAMPQIYDPLKAYKPMVLDVLNTNTKKFHIPTCRSVKQMKDKNKKDFCGSREEVIAKGYSPCKNCNP